MVLAVTDIKDKTLFDNTIIEAIIESQFVYGNPLEVNIGVATDIGLLEVGKNYNIVFQEVAPKLMNLLSVNIDFINNKEYLFYKFVIIGFEKILRNEYPIKSSIYGVSFNRYILGLDKQIQYFSKELKKQGLILTLDKDYNVKQKHITSEVFKVENFDKNIYDVKEIKDIEFRQQAYYTNDNNQNLKVTNNNIGLPKYIPFHNSKDIQGLSNYLIPKYELSKDFSIYKIGDKVIIDNNKCVIMEKSTLFYKGKSKSVMVAGILPQVDNKKNNIVHTLIDYTLNDSCSKKTLKELVEGLDERLIKIIEKAKKECKYKFTILEGYITPEQQYSLYEIGRTKQLDKDIVTEADGYNIKSDYQSGLVVSVAPCKDGKPLLEYKDNEKYWLEIGRAMLRASRRLDYELLWGLSYSEDNVSRFELI